MTLWYQSQLLIVSDLSVASIISWNHNRVVSLKAQESRDVAFLSLARQLLNIPVEINVSLRCYIPHIGHTSHLWFWITFHMLMVSKNFSHENSILASFKSFLPQRKPTIRYLLFYGYKCLVSWCVHAMHNLACIVHGALLVLCISFYEVLNKKEITKVHITIPLFFPSLYLRPLPFLPLTVIPICFIPSIPSFFHCFLSLLPSCPCPFLSLGHRVI